FFVSTRRMEGKQEGKGANWPGRTAWAGRLSEDQAQKLAAPLKKTKVRLPKNAYLTVFDDESDPRPGTSDLFFSTSQAQSNVRLRPQIIYEYADEAEGGGSGGRGPLLWLLGGLTVGALVIVGLVLWLANRGKGPPVTT